MIVAKFWLSEWRPQGGPHISGVGNARGDEERDFVGGTVRLTASTGGWGWNIYVKGKIVDSHRGWGSSTKHDGLKCAERAARNYDNRKRREAGQTGVCPMCDADILLTPAGRIQQHADRRIYQCSGSGRKPKKVETTA